MADAMPSSIVYILFHEIDYGLQNYVSLIQVQKFVFLDGTICSIDATVVFSINIWIPK